MNNNYSSESKRTHIWPKCISTKESFTWHTRWNTKIYANSNIATYSTTITFIIRHYPIYFLHNCKKNYKRFYLKNKEKKKIAIKHTLFCFLLNKLKTLMILFKERLSSLDKQERKTNKRTNIKDLRQRLILYNLLVLFLYLSRK